jgi:hypothetical protein
MPKKNPAKKNSSTMKVEKKWLIIGVVVVVLLLGKLGYESMVQAVAINHIAGGTNECGSITSGGGAKAFVKVAEKRCSVVKQQITKQGKPALIRRRPLPDRK